MSSGKVLLGLLAGVTAGALLGILFAPDKGSKTRRQIIDKGDEYADDLNRKFEEFLAGISKKYETTKRAAEELVDKGKFKYDDVKKDLKNASSEIKNSAS